MYGVDSTGLEEGPVAGIRERGSVRAQNFLTS
jgi:hypothetical protein